VETVGTTHQSSHSLGHMKDEINLIDCKTFEEVEKVIDVYMDYYNNYRYQWNLNRMSPKAYGNKLRNQTYKNGRSILEQPSFLQH